jgi:hypothetical protein
VDGDWAAQTSYTITLAVTAQDAALLGGHFQATLAYGDITPDDGTDGTWFAGVSDTNSVNGTPDTIVAAPATYTWTIVTKNSFTPSSGVAPVFQINTKSSSGWGEFADGSTYGFSGTLTIVGTPLTATTATFKANGGTGADVVVDVNLGDAVSVAAVPTTFTNTGKLLKGWSTSSGGTPQVDPTAATLNAAAVYHAIWVDDDKVWEVTVGDAITFADWADDDYVEVTLTVKAGESNPGSGWGLGAFQNAAYANVIEFKTPDATGTEFKVKYLIATLKAIIGESSTQVAVWHNSYNHTVKKITYTAPPAGITVRLIQDQYSPSPQWRETLSTLGLTIAATKYKVTITGTSDKALDAVQITFRNSTWGGNYSGYDSIPVGDFVYVSYLGDSAATLLDANNFEIVYKGTDTSFTQDVTYATLSNVVITFEAIAD